MERIEAPFTRTVAIALNRYQFAHKFHPFTCGSGNRGDEAHSATFKQIGVDQGLLIANKDGWFCPSCDYRQSWAHNAMTNPPRDMFGSSSDDAVKFGKKAAVGLFAAILMNLAECEWEEALESAVNGDGDYGETFAEIYSAASDEYSYWCEDRDA